MNLDTLIVIQEYKAGLTELVFKLKLIVFLRGESEAMVALHDYMPKQTFLIPFSRKETVVAIHQKNETTLSHLKLLFDIHGLFVDQ